MLRVNPFSVSFYILLSNRKFIIYLLSDEKYKKIIRWSGDRGVFIIKDTKALAKLWGQQKKNNRMTYNSIGRSFRFYYRKNIMQKDKEQHGFKFVFDFKKMVGYNIEDLIKIKSGISLDTLATTGPNRSSQVKNASKKIAVKKMSISKIYTQLEYLKKRVAFLEKIHN